MNHDVRLVASPSPLSLDRGRIDRMVPADLTVAGHMRTIGLAPEGLWARVFIDGRLIPQAEWEWAMPAPSQCLTIRVIPMGGDGGGKMAIRIVAMLAVVVAAAYTGGAAATALGPSGSGLFGAAGATAIGHGIAAAISMASMLAINSLIPPPLPRLIQVSQPN